MLLKFGSRLDKNLKDLHRTVLGSRTMEEHTHSFLAHKYDVRKDYNTISFHGTF